MNDTDKSLVKCTKIRIGPDTLLRILYVPLSDYTQRRIKQAAFKTLYCELQTNLLIIIFEIHPITFILCL